MKVEARIFEFLTAFFFVVGIVYMILSQEPAGIAALFLTGGLSLIVGTYFRFVARRLEDRGPRTTRRPRSPTARARSASSRRAATGRSRSPARSALVGLSLAFMYSSGPS